MFRTRYERKKLTNHINPSGSPIRVKRGWIYEDGEMVFKEKGLTNVYEEIQAMADTVDIHKIMERYENGDESALNKVQGMYIDTVELPKNYAQLYDAVSKADMVFDSMPHEIKEQFNNNPATFWKNYGAETFDNIINSYRSETLQRYGMIDENPVNTVNEKVIEPFEPVVTSDTKESVKDE